METIDSLNKLLEQRTWNPQFSIIDSVRQDNSGNYPVVITGLFLIAFRFPIDENLAFGCKNCDFKDMTISFYAPEEKVNLDSVKLLIAFHPDLFAWTSCKRKESDYTFFHYTEKESLHISKRESMVLSAQIENMRQEMMHCIDYYSYRLLTSQLETLLDYCLRYYERQFIMRETEGHKIVNEINRFLDTYILRPSSKTKGLPSVSRIAAELGVSPAYLNDLMKVNTGKKTSCYIKFRLVDMAKQRLSGHGENITGIAGALGFSDVATFNRVFKEVSGVTPEEYCTVTN